VLLGEENLCQQALTNFVYKYSGKPIEDDTDSCTMTFTFANAIPIPMRLFKPGNAFLVKWGYMGGYLATRAVTVNKVSSKADSMGFTIVVELIPTVLYKDKSGGGWSTLEEALSVMGDSSIIWSWYDDDSNRITVETTAKDPMNPIVSQGDFMVLAKPLDPGFSPEELQKAAEELSRSAQTRANQQGFYEQGRKGWATKAELEAQAAERRKTLWGVEPSSIADTLATTLVRWITDWVAGSHLEARDQTFLVQPPNPDDAVALWFNIVLGPQGRPRGVGPGNSIISISIEESKEEKNQPAHTGVAIDPEEGEVAVVSSKTTSSEPDTSSYPPQINTEVPGEGQIKVPVALVDPAGPIHKPIPPINYIVDEGTLFIQGTDTIFKAKEETAERFKINWKKARIQKAETGEWRAAKDFSYLDQVTPIMPGGEPLPPEETEYAKAEREAKDYQRSVRLTQGVTNDNLDRVMVKTYAGKTKEEVINAIRGRDLYAYFNQMQARVIMEGDPRITIGFNFMVTGLGDFMDGKFTSQTVTHSIAGGKYTTSVEGGKIPRDYTNLVSTAVHRVEEAFINIDKQSRIHAVRESNEAFGPEETFEGLQENPTGGSNFRVISSMVDFYQNRIYAKPGLNGLTIESDAPFDQESSAWPHKPVGN